MRIRTRLAFVVFAYALAMTVSGSGRAYGYDANLVSDGYFSFAGQAKDWDQPYFPLTIGGASWSELDAGGAPGGVGSGSLAVAVNYRGGGFTALTCVPVVGGATYVLGGDFFVPATPDDGFAELTVLPYTKDNCWGTIPDGPAPPVLDVAVASPDWQHRSSADYVVPAGTRSLAIRASAFHSLGTLFGAFSANFDNVSLVGEVPTDVPLNLYVGGSDGPGARKGQFAVSATWHAYDGSSGPALPQRLTVDSGYLWFFAPNNIELTVKVLDACNAALGDRFWVFIAGMTDVQVDITVEDLATGAVKTYSSPLGTPFATITDTTGFPCSPSGP